MTERSKRAGAPGIKITSEMVLAGEQVLAESVGGMEGAFLDLAELACQVFAAMESCRRLKRDIAGTIKAEAAKAKSAAP